MASKGRGGDTVRHWEMACVTRGGVELQSTHQGRGNITHCWHFSAAGKRGVKGQGVGVEGRDEGGKRRERKGKGTGLRRGRGGERGEAEGEEGGGCQGVLCLKFGPGHYRLDVFGPTMAI